MEHTLQQKLQQQKSFNKKKSNSTKKIKLKLKHPIPR
jgi:hypothetical protein